MLSRVIVVAASFAAFFFLVPSTTVAVSSSDPLPQQQAPRIPDGSGATTSWGLALPSWFRPPPTKQQQQEPRSFWGRKAVDFVSSSSSTLSFRFGGKNGVPSIEKSSSSSSSSLASTTTTTTKMPSLFFGTSGESMYDRYAACLAATEGLRKTRDEALAVKKKKGEDRDAILSRYAKQSSRVIQALGLTVEQFNTLGKTIAKNDTLKDRVMEQAYLYRMAATVNMEHMPIAGSPGRTSSPSPSSSSAFAKASQQKQHRRGGGSSRRLSTAAASYLFAEGNDKKDQDRKLRLFARSMMEVESLRTTQTHKLQSVLGLTPEETPLFYCDAALRPLLDRRVRGVIEAFPLQAQELIQKHGLSTDEFNVFLEEVKTNPWFRSKVKKLTQDLDKRSLPSSSLTKE